MKLSAPKQGTFWLSLVLFIIGLVGHFVPSIPFVSAYNFIIIIVSEVVLLLGCAVKGF